MSTQPNQQPTHYGGQPVPNVVPPPPQRPQGTPQQVQKPWHPLQPGKMGPGSLIVSISALLLIVGAIILILAHFAVPAGPAKVGDTITLDNISCTLLSVNSHEEPWYWGYITITVKTVNNSESEYHYDISDFKLKSSSGLIIDPNSFGGASLAPGGNTQGTIDFQINDPKGSSLLWQPIDHRDELSHVWNLGL